MTAVSTTETTRMTRRLPRFRTPRNAEFTSLLESFLIAAIATVLIIRTQLWLTNYPQLGGGGLHIAHLLWGGLGMMIAVVVMAIFISPAARRFGAVVGGIGFGFFIDELGKFVTSDNNYFFRPTAAMIYIIFIIFYLVTRRARSRHGFTEQEYLLNTIELLKEVALHDMDERDKERALELLDEADQSQPLVGQLRTVLTEATVVEERPTFLVRFARRARAGYFNLIEARWFQNVLVGVFAVWGVLSMAAAVILTGYVIQELIEDGATQVLNDLDDTKGELTVFVLGRVISAAVAGAVALVGVARLLRGAPRLAAYRMFERALLISLLITQFCAFVETQFGAVISFLINICLWLTVRYMIRSENELERHEHAAEVAAARTTSGEKPDVAPATG